MTINDLLCKYIDHGDNEYVTLWDVVKGVGSLLVGGACVSGLVLATAYMYFRGALLVTQGSLVYGTMVTGADMMCITVFVVIDMAIVGAGAIAVAHKLASIRVATCKRKEGGDE